MEEPQMSQVYTPNRVDTRITLREKFSDVYVVFVFVNVVQCLLEIYKIHLQAVMGLRTFHQVCSFTVVNSQALYSSWTTAFALY